MKTPYPHQEANIVRAYANLASCGPRWLFGNETGIGKTGEALTLLKRMDWKGDILIISEAITRGHWRNELQQWWPERFEAPDSVGLVNMSPGRKTQTKKQLASWPTVLAAPARVVSYDLLDPARDLRPNQAVLLDEVHLLINPAAKRSRNVRGVLLDNRSPLFELTATPQPDRPEQIWNLLSILCPMRYGRNPKKPSTGEKAAAAFDFLNRYLERVPGTYGSSWGRLREEMADELRWRIECVMSRTTRAEIAHLLPPVQVVPLPQPAARNRDELVAEWAANKTGEATHCVVLCHKRTSAYKLGEQLKAKFPDHYVEVITGALTPDERVARIEMLKCAPKAILVATMHSITRGISLSFAKRWLFAELYWRPETLIQVVGRGSRLDNIGGEPPLFEILCQDGSLEQRQCNAIAEKLMQIHMTTGAGQTDGALRTAMTPSEEMMEQMLKDAAWQPDWVDEIDSTIDYEDDMEDG